MDIQIAELTRIIDFVVKKTLTEAGFIKNTISKAEAYRLFTRRSVDKWIKRGEIQPIKNTEGGNVRFDRLEMDLLDKRNILNDDYGA